MNRSPGFALFTSVGIAVLWSAGIGSAASAAAASNGVCQPVTGVQWVAPYAPHPSGTTYTVQVNTGSGNPKKETFDPSDFFSWTV